VLSPKDLDCPQGNTELKGAGFLQMQDVCVKMDQMIRYRQAATQPRGNTAFVEQARKGKQLKAAAP
jgi:hypothetical protein